MRRRVVTVEQLRRRPEPKQPAPETPKEQRRAAERLRNAKTHLTYRPFAGLKKSND